MKRLQGYWLVTLAYSFNAVFLVIGSMAFAQTPITSSGLNTQISGPIAVGGQTQFNITGGTRPGGGTNLFHSFGNFSVPNNNIANFLNNSGLPTTNILGRVTGGNVSNIFGTIQTTGFGNANLYLMNPAGFLFGQGATVNVGGMVTFTSADYLRLADGARFNAIRKASADALLSIAPVAAFGFLGSNPGAITVQGSHLTVAEGTGISLVGGNITVQGGTLTAPSGQINLVSVGKPSNPHVAGEVVIAGSGAGPGFNPTGFATLGAISLSQGSTVDASAIEGSHHDAGRVLIRGGELVMDNSSIEATVQQHVDPGTVRGTIEVTAEQVTLSNHSSIDTFADLFTSLPHPTSHITFNVGTFSATDSTVSAGAVEAGGTVTIQGLQGSGTSAHAVSLTNSSIDTSSFFVSVGGAISIRSENIMLNHASLHANAIDGSGGAISLLSSRNIKSHDSSFEAHTLQDSRSGGTIDLRAGQGIDLTNTSLDAHSSLGLRGGTITVAAPIISIRGSTLDVRGHGTFLGGGGGGTINLTGTKGVSLTESTLSAQSLQGNGGSIQVEAQKVQLTDTQLNTSVTGGPQTVGGTISIDAKNATLTNSQILSTATQGHGGTITINSNVLHRDPSTVIDASSQSGTDGTVTINGVIQP